MGAGASAAFPDGADEITKEQAQAIAGDKFSEELWDEKTFGLGNLSKDDWDALVKADSYRKFFLAELQPVLDSVHAAGKTPLVIGDKEDKVATFFQYQNARIVEAKKLIKEVSVDKTKTAAEACEDLRKDLLAAFQQVPPHNGCPLLIRMANSAADFSNTFHGDTTFPLAVFDPAEWAKEAVHMQVVRDADKAKTGNMFLPAADFRVIVTSTFSAGDAEGFLKGSLPLDKFELLHLVPGEPPPKWAPAHGAVVACAAAHAPDGIRAAEGGDVVFATMLKWADGGECSVKFGNAKVKMVPSSAISQAPDGSAVTAPAADDNKAAGPATAAAAKGGKKKAAKKKKGGGKKKAKKKN